MSEQTILLVGAGAVGASIAAWLSPEHNNFYVFDREETVTTINNNGISSYLQHNKDKSVTSKVKAISSLNDCPKPDIILLCVKNYSLEGLSQAIISAFGADCQRNTLVVGLQNGVENQNILPKYFSKVIYGIISFNAWLDSPGVVGYQAKGPFIFGTPDNDKMHDVRRVTAIFNKGVAAVATEHFQDAALSKMIINLTNSFTTLTGLGYREIDNASLFQKILSRLTYEGVNIVKAAGYKECKVGDIPGWFLIKTSALLPQFLTRRIFAKNVKKMVVSSMAQDILQNGRGNTELDDINGHILSLARQHGVDAPYNQAIYKLCQQCFAEDNFKPMSVDEVWVRMRV